MSVSKTIVISCAGMGSRLGIGSTKALLDIEGRPLIIRQLELLARYDDIRIVVGYQAARVIETVLSYRRDILFVFNHDYMHTGTGASLSLGSHFSGDKVVSLDGDVLVHPDDFQQFLDEEEDCIGVCEPYSDEPLYCESREEDSGAAYAVRFTTEKAQYEWTGLLQITAARLNLGTGHVYQMLEPILPIKTKLLRTREIDTMQDYERAVVWVRNGYR